MVSQKEIFTYFLISHIYNESPCLSVTMRKYDTTYIRDPDTNLNFDLKVKFIGFLTCFRVRPITLFWFDIGLPYLAHGCFTIRRCLAYIHDPDMILNFDLKVKFKRFFFTCFCVRYITYFGLTLASQIGT